jgi:hypothetical protein
VAGVFDGVDPFPRWSREAQEKFGELPGVHFKVGNIESIEAADNSYDQLICMAVLEYLNTSRPCARGNGPRAEARGDRNYHHAQTLARESRAQSRHEAGTVGGEDVWRGDCDHLPRLRLQPQELDQAAQRAGLILKVVAVSLSRRLHIH